MAWGRLDDRLHDNGKVWSFSDKAFRVWMYSISYCNKKRRTDPEGTLTLAEANGMCRLAGAKESIIAELLAKGGWEMAEDGVRYRVHDFPSFGPADETAPDRMRRLREKQRNESVTVTRNDTVTVTEDVTLLAGAYARACPVPNPVPVPVPNPEEEKDVNLCGDSAAMPHESAEKPAKAAKPRSEKQARVAAVADAITAVGLKYRITPRDADRINGAKDFDPGLIAEALGAAERGEWDPQFFASNFALHFVIDRINAYLRWKANPQAVLNGHARASPVRHPGGGAAFAKWTPKD